jgi:hypothetical protein
MEKHTHGKMELSEYIQKKIYIQEQIFEVHGSIVPKLDIDQHYDPIEFNKYLNNFRTIRIKNNNYNLEKKNCQIMGLNSGRHVPIDCDYLNFMNIQRISDIDDTLFIEFMLDLRSMIHGINAKNILNQSVGRYLIDQDAYLRYIPKQYSLSSMRDNTDIQYLQTARTNSEQEYTIRVRMLDHDHNDENNASLSNINIVGEELNMGIHMIEPEDKSEDKSHYKVRIKNMDNQNNGIPHGYTGSIRKLEKLILVMQVNPHGSMAQYPDFLSTIGLKYSIGPSDINYDGYLLIYLNEKKKIQFDSVRTFYINLPSLYLNLSHLVTDLTIHLTVENEKMFDISGYIATKEKIHLGIHKILPMYHYETPYHCNENYTVSHCGNKIERSVMRIRSFGDCVFTKSIFILAIKKGVYDVMFNPFKKLIIMVNGHVCCEINKKSSELCHQMIHGNEKKLDPNVLYWSFSYNADSVTGKFCFDRIDTVEFILEHEPFDGEFRIYTESYRVICEHNGKIDRIIADTYELQGYINALLSAKM